jgi:hypothetical protein
MPVLSIVAVYFSTTAFVEIQLDKVKKSSIPDGMLLRQFEVSNATYAC